jgi:hypothetical protein
VDHEFREGLLPPETKNYFLAARVLMTFLCGFFAPFSNFCIADRYKRHAIYSFRYSDITRSCIKELHNGARTMYVKQCDCLKHCL